MKEEETFCYFTSGELKKGSIKKTDLDETHILIESWEWDDKSPTGIRWSSTPDPEESCVNWIDIAVDFIAREFPDSAKYWIESLYENQGKFPDRNWIKALRIARDKKDIKNFNYVIATAKGLGKRKKKEKPTAKIDPRDAERAKEAAQKEAEKFALMGDAVKWKK